MSRSTSLQQLLDQPERREGELLEFAVEPNSQPASPTLQVSAEWQFYFSHFNARLFDNALPDCLIRFTKLPFAQGYFCVDAFKDRNGAFAHEIAMNPAHFSKGDAETFATLVHEMCHLWRHLFGRPNRKGGYGAPGYHDVVWADKMESIGLMPSDTGKPGGKRTGFHMLDYPIEGGSFDLACRELLIGGHTVNWRDSRDPEWLDYPFFDAEDGNAGGQTAAAKPRRKATRTRFICKGCSLLVESRKSARLACLDCNRPLVKR